jgi:hypothetical protein
MMEAKASSETLGLFNQNENLENIHCVSVKQHASITNQWHTPSFARISIDSGHIAFGHVLLVGPYLGTAELHLALLIRSS